MDRQRLIAKISRFELGDSQYKITKELGRGGNGVAFLCQSGKKRQVVAKLYIPPDKRDLDDKALERFETEIALTKRLKHPNIVTSLGSGALNVGAYRLPFYLMPYAPATLRREVRVDSDPSQIEKKLRIFTRAAYGVACLHSHGVVHRDLKPENILISNAGAPWIADLGIAHVNPEFVSVGMKTIESERLLNRDYYAPEQRFGKATSVDNRADVYALGCILYELLTSIPPVRTNSPKLSMISSAFEPFEPIWLRMTAWDVDQRYPTIEDALEDLSVATGWVIASLRGAAGLEHPDVATMAKLLRSSNDTQRRRGVDLAVRLGQSSLTELHTLTGHSRRDVRNAVGSALARIADPSSVPFLVGGLYGVNYNASQYRPSMDVAAQALGMFPSELRVDAINSLTRPIRPSQIAQILAGHDMSQAYELAAQLREKKLIFTDWSETDLELFVSIDEERTWPEVKRLSSRGFDFKVRSLFPKLGPARQVEVLFDVMNADTRDSWQYGWILEAILRVESDSETRQLLLLMLQDKINDHNGPFRDRDSLLRRISTELP